MAGSVAILVLSAPAAKTGLSHNTRIATDPATQLPALYRPRDAGDKSALDAMNALFQGAEGLRAIARAVRSEPAGDGCEWIMAVDLNWANSFGQRRSKVVQMRVELEAASGAARVKRVFGGTGF